jgi:hypothetical protein
VARVYRLRLIVLNVQAVAKYMPTAEPMLDTTVYEMVLQDFLQNNHEVLSLLYLCLLLIIIIET